MTDVTVVKFLVLVFAVLAAVAIVGTLLFLWRLRDKVRKHRHVKRMIIEASTPTLPFDRQQQPLR